MYCSLLYKYSSPIFGWQCKIRQCSLSWLIFQLLRVSSFSKVYIFYVYWTAHHLDSWIKTDQLDVTCFIISLFTGQHVSNVNTFIFRNLRLIVDLSLGLYCSVRIEVLALASLFCGEWLVVTCVVVLIRVFL